MDIGGKPVKFLVNTSATKFWTPDQANLVTIFVKLRRYHGRLKNIYSDTSLYQEIRKISNNLNLLLKQLEKKKNKIKSY